MEKDHNLLSAVQNGDLVKVKDLLKNGVNVNAKDKISTPLFIGRSKRVIGIFATCFSKQGQVQMQRIKKDLYLWK